jgi:fatty acid desaturase
MRFGHLLHHSANRHVFDRPEAVPPGGSRVSSAGPYYLKLLGGHALISSTYAIALALPPRIAAWLIERIASGVEHAAMRSAAFRALTNAGRRRRIRFDLFVICALLALASYCWRAHWPVLAASIAARHLALSLLDNAPHYGTALDSGTNARNTSLPRWASWIVLGQNFHGIHHGSPGLRWHDLRRAFERSASRYDGSWLASVLRQFRGPIVLDGRVHR